MTEERYTVEKHPAGTFVVKAPNGKVIWAGVRRKDAQRAADLNNADLDAARAEGE